MRGEVGYEVTYSPGIARLQSFAVNRFAFGARGARRERQLIPSLSTARTAARRWYSGMLAPMLWLGRLWKVLLFCGGILMFAAQVGPDDAASNLSRWTKQRFDVEMPAWLATSTAGLWATGAAVVLVGAGIAACLWLLRRQRAKPSLSTTTIDALVPFEVAIKRFGDAVPDIFDSYFDKATHERQSIDEKMRRRAYRVWRLVPLQVMFRDSERHKPIKYEERNDLIIAFKAGAPVLLKGQEVIANIAILEDDLSKAIERAPNVPPDDLVLLQDAVKELYDATRHSNAVIAFANVQETEDDKLSWLANELWKHVLLQVQYGISNTFEPLSRDRREDKYLVFREGKPLLIYDHGLEEQIAARSIAVLRRELDAAIESIKAAGRKAKNA